MTLKKRLAKLERAVNPDPGVSMLFQDEKGVLRDVEGNVITEEPSGMVMIFDEEIRDV